MTELVLQADGLRKEFGDFVAVHEAALQIAPGGSLGLVGESGSGKSTIARMIVGLERPTAGTIVCCGRDRSAPARSTRERRRRGGEAQIVFQDPYSSLDPRQTVRAALEEVLRSTATTTGSSAKTACVKSRQPSRLRIASCGRCPVRCRAANGSAWRSPGRFVRIHA